MNLVKYTCFLFCFSFSMMGWSQDSLNMVKVGQWNPTGMPIYSGVTYNDVWGYTTSTGEEYAIIGNVDSILIVDITDCHNPVRVFGYEGGSTVIWRDFKTYGDYVYGVCDSCDEGLHIFNMSALPGGAITHELTTTAFFDRAHNIWIDEAKSKLYAAGTNVADEGVVILDLANPADPSLIKNVQFDDEIGLPSENFYVHDIYVRNDTAYTSHGYQGYYVWDLANVNNIIHLGDYDGGGYNHSSWTTADGAYAYYAEEVPTGRPMAVVDLANLGSMTNDISVVNTFEHSLGSTPDATPHNPFIKDDTLYISYYEDGIKVYDLSNPTSPTYVGYYDTYLDNGNGYNGYQGAWGTYPFFNSGCICVSDIKYGLNILRNCTTQTYYQDADGDGYGNLNVSITQCGTPAGYTIDKNDCDDTDPNINPGAAEICDGEDNNCNGEIDEGVMTTYYLDLDEDNYGGPNNTVESCTPIVGYITVGGDCDDENQEIYPGAPEICDGEDNNCNGQVDEGLLTEYFEDLDNDSYGNPNSSIMACTLPSGYVIDNTDCDDAQATVYPGATEICDGLDNDCNGQVDEGLTFYTFYEDQDGDSFGNNNVSTTACSTPAGYVTDNTDCDDMQASINPNATEICDGLDNNCDGQTDEGLLITFYEDQDGDSYGNNSVTTDACSAPAGYVADNTDCDDSQANSYPGATEICDGQDNDCDGQTDEGCTLFPCDSINIFLSSIAQDTYRIKQHLDTDAFVSPSENIALFAGDDIDLLPDFEVGLGAEFLANIEDCDSANLSPVVGPTTTAIISAYMKAKEESNVLYILTEKDKEINWTFLNTKALLKFLQNCPKDKLYLLYSKTAN